MSVSIDVSELEGAIEQEFQNFVRGKCVETLKSVCPVDSGAMKAEIHAERINDETYWVGTNKWYAKFTEYGRGPVKPVRRKALYWPDIWGGRPVSYAGPAEAQHWVEKAVSQLN